MSGRLASAGGGTLGGIVIWTTVFCGVMLGTVAAITFVDVAWQVVPLKIAGMPALGICRQVACAETLSKSAEAEKIRRDLICM